MPYVQKIVQTLHSDMMDYYGDHTPLVVTDDGSELASLTTDTVFLIGENLKDLEGPSSRRLVFINFSVVTVLGNLFSTGINGWLQIRRKRKLLEEKAHVIHSILDYYPSQTPRLAELSMIPALGFLPYIRPELVPKADLVEHRAHDICFVGNMSARRQKIVRFLKSKGLSFTESHGKDLEDLASTAKISINIHNQRSNHLEIPRLIGAMAAGTAIVTEDSYGLDSVLDRTTLLSVKYSQLTSSILKLARDPLRIRDLRDRSTEWYRTVYVPRARRRFFEALDQIEALPLNARGKHPQNPSQSRTAR